VEAGFLGGPTRVKRGPTQNMEIRKIGIREKKSLKLKRDIMLIFFISNDFI
jgi:hypothetical protein